MEQPSSFATQVRIVKSVIFINSYMVCNKVPMTCFTSQVIEKFKIKKSKSDNYVFYKQSTMGIIYMWNCHYLEMILQVFIS